MARMAIVAVLAIILPAWTQPGGGIGRFAESTETTDKTVDGTGRTAGQNMDLARQLIGDRSFTGAINRLKIVVTRFPTSQFVEEALARLAECYLAFDVPSEAQTAVAVLGRKFPNGHWYIDARDALKAAGLEPVEDERSWISHAFK